MICPLAPHRLSDEGMERFGAGLNRARRALAAFAFVVAPVAAAQEAPDPMVVAVADNMRAAGAAGLPGGITVVSARAEGHMLVLVLSLPPALRPAFTPPLVSAMVASGMCQEGAGEIYFVDGRSLRVDLEVDGAVTSGTVRGHCPTAAEAELGAGNVAALLQANAGRRLQNGAFLSGAHAEGDRMVVTFDGPAGWRTAAAMASLNAEFLAGFCRRQTWLYFDHGRTLQLEMREAGADPQRAPVADRCPDP